MVSLCGMYDLEDCTTALRRNGDDLERAANWLFDKDAPRILQAERVGVLSCWRCTSVPFSWLFVIPVHKHICTHGITLSETFSVALLLLICTDCYRPCCADLNCCVDLNYLITWQEAKAAASKLGNPGASASVEKDAVRLSKARELSGISGMPVDISFHALRLFGENPDRAMGWMMDEGIEYVSMLRDASYQEAERAADEKAESLALEREKQSDEAALDDTGVLA